MIVTKIEKSFWVIGISYKNAVLVAARILAYGPEYTTEILNPNDIF